MDNKAAQDAALVRQAMEALLPKIMAAPPQAASQASTPGVVSEIQKYFANAMMPMNAITKFRDEVTLFMQIMAGMKGASLKHERFETNNFFQKPVTDPLSYAELNVYEIGRGGFGLIINGTDNWFYLNEAQDSLVKLLRHPSQCYKFDIDGRSTERFPYGKLG